MPSSVPFARSREAIAGPEAPHSSSPASQQKLWEHPAPLRVGGAVGLKPSTWVRDSAGSHTSTHKLTLQFAGSEPVPAGRDSWAAIWKLMLA